MPPTRREQLALDELLGDIYLGIESLPDRSRTSTASKPSSINNHQHNSYSVDFNKPKASASDYQPQQSNQQPQSLASIVTTTTPRRVRIVEPPDKKVKGYNSLSSNLDSGGREQIERRPQTNVKYVNTNKLIYHQEKNPDDDDDDENYVEDRVTNDSSQEEEEEETLAADGVTRVKYYHTTWLDRQLGRASKRRSSKELNERQVKEKAMIEELKRSLKNGAITLRQSFKGKNRNQKNKQSVFDDLITDDDHQYNNNNYSTTTPSDSTRKLKQRETPAPTPTPVIRTGVATVPRNYQHQKRQTSNEKQQQYSQQTKHFSNTLSPKQQYKQQAYREESSINNNNTQVTPQVKQQFSSEPVASSTTKVNSSHNLTPTSTTNHHNQPMQTPQPEVKVNYYSRTLPHNYHINHNRKSEHQLLQSHYRGGQQNFANSASLRPTTGNSSSNNNMRNNLNNNQNTNYSNYGTTSRSPTTNNFYNNQQQQPQTQQLAGNTISSIPSATEVVRSALSRSSSQASLNHLNKTINLLPNSPPPCNPSPMSTPVQQLKAASPSLSPSPVRPTFHQPHQQQQRQNSDYSNNYQRQPVYANPHASLMQHRQDEQMRKPGGRNNTSIREFNELDSLLRSLSPGSTRTTTAATTTASQITPGFSSKPAQPSFGFGFTPAANNQQQQQQQLKSNLTNNSAAIYAKVQKQPNTTYTAMQQANNNNSNNEQTKASYLQQNYLQANMIQNHEPQYIIDVTNKKADENCLQRQNLSEFEPPGELLPSMEDYQNISRLNPVKNHYWYKPNMSRERAVDLLKDKPQGTFIVRDSTSFRGAFGLAVKVSKLPKNVLNNASLRNPNGDPSAELIRHFLIEPTPSGVRLKGYANEPVFGSLPALIYQHSLVELALPCKLVIPRADIEDVNFNYKQKQYYDEFLASKEQAKHPLYESTSPNGGYRKYPGDVYVHNEHRIIFE